MNYQHQGLAQGRWHTFPLSFQMANIGSEVGRAIAWREKGNEEYSQKAFDRSLELFDLTLSDPKNKHRTKEVARARELWVDYTFADNQYHSNSLFFNTYFLAFAHISHI